MSMLSMVYFMRIMSTIQRASKSALHLQKGNFHSLWRYTNKTEPFLNSHLGLSTTKDLLSKSVLRYSAYTMAVVTCLGNSLVLWGRYTQRDENRALSIVIRNLAVSDMLMGLYLSFIVIQDHRFREQYHFKSLEWVTSWSCIVIGMLAVTSSEVSLLILTFISIERFLLIAGPFNSRKRLNTNNIQLCLLVIWLCGATIALFPGRYICVLTP